MDRYSTEINCTEFTFLSNKQDPQPEMGGSPPKKNEGEEDSKSEAPNSNDDLPF